MAYSQLSVFITLVFVVHYSQNVFSSKMANSFQDLKSIIINSLILQNDNEPLEADVNDNSTLGVSKTRVKRQGAGKFTDAAKTSQTKVARLVGQMMKNLWAPYYVGGAHPLHHEIPKPVVFLFKQRIMDYFFPDVEEEPKVIINHSQIVRTKEFTEQTTNGVHNVFENVSEFAEGVESNRIKRQVYRDDDGEIMDKYTEVVKLPLKKMVPMILKVFKDIWAASEYGGKRSIFKWVSTPAKYIIGQFSSYFEQKNHSRTMDDRMGTHLQ